MLPKETGNLVNAVTSTQQTRIDPDRLKIELAGMEAFQELLDNNLLTPAQNELYQKYVGNYMNLTAPAEGSPSVFFEPAAASTYGMSRFVSLLAEAVECPNCHHRFTP
jgi:hypothetical protein